MTTPQPDADGWIAHEGNAGPDCRFVEVKDDFDAQYADDTSQVFWNAHAAMPRVLSYRPLVPKIELDKALARIAELGWQPIETAPEGVVVIVGWRDKDSEYPEQYVFDCQEDGCWLTHNDSYGHFMAVGGSAAAGPDATCTGPSQNAPYTHWMPIQEMPK